LLSRSKRLRNEAVEPADADAADDKEEEEESFQPTMALGSTQPLTEMSTRDLPEG
jgi:hypothetical protein